jgi:hypothetical protein
MENLGIQDIIQRHGLDRAVFRGWRFLLLEGDAAVAAAEIGVDKQSGAFSFAGVNAGPYVSSTAEALRALPTQSGFVQGDWSIRLLRIPALFFLAIWCHEEQATDDQLWPLAPTPITIALWAEEGFGVARIKRAHFANASQDCEGRREPLCIR